MDIQTNERRATMTVQHSLARALMLGTGLALVLPAQAFAQSAPGASTTAPASAAPQYAAPDDETDEGGDVIVVTGLRAGIERSITAKRNAVNVVDVISAEDIGKFPDTNVAEALQRIPSVTIDRSELGEGRTVNLRGLGTGFTRTEINGGFAINGLDLGVLAPELFTRLTIEKSSSASSVEGGLAGTIKIETVKPFDSQGFRAIGVAGVTIGQKADTVPRVFGLISKNWDDRFGIAIGLAYSKVDYATNELAYGPWVEFRRAASAATIATAPADLLAAATPRTAAYYSYREKRDNIGGTLAIQARPSDAIALSADFLYAEADGARTDDRPDIPLEGNLSAPTNYVIEDGVVTSATFSGVQNRVGTSYRPQFQRVWQGTLRAEIQPFDRFTIRPAFAYAKRKERSELHLFSFAINNTTISYALDGAMPDFSSTATDFLSNPEDFGFNVIIFDKFEQETDEKLGKVDFQYDLDDTGNFSILAGARYTARSTTRRTAFAGIFQDVTPLPSLDDVVTTRPFYVRGSPSQTPSRILAADRHLVQQLFYPGNNDPWAGGPGIYTQPSDDRVGGFTVEEDTLAAYVQGDFLLGPVTMNAGVRFVQTETNTSGFQRVDGVILPVTDKGKSTNWLPAVNARYNINETMVLRAALTRSLTRPDLQQLAPGQVINSGPRTGSRGNPSLMPYEADQADLSFEYYWHPGSLFNIGVFYKKIRNLITNEVVNEEATFPDQLTGLPTTGIIAFTQPTNGDNAKVQGLEVGVQSNFYFLPGALSGLGGILNYTRASNKATIRNTTTGETSQSRLPGLSTNQLNAVLYYEKGGFDARLAYAYRSTYRRADPVGAQFGAERYVRGYGQLDFSMTVPIGRNFELSADVTNVLDTQRKEFILIPTTGATPPANVIETERRFILTARAVF